MAIAQGKIETQQVKSWFASGKIHSKSSTFASNNLNQ